MVDLIDIERLVKDSYPECNESSSNLVSTGFLNEVMIVVPQHYLSRQGDRVDICGNVHDDTYEYEQGYRFFSSLCEFFHADGGLNLEGSHVCDLIGLLEKDEVENTKAPISPYIWVHPRHRNYSTWFGALSLSGERNIVCHYINRMGFVLDISINDDGVIKDKLGRVYNEDGTVYKDKPSMYDLMKKVDFWEKFKQLDWQSDKSLTEKMDSSPQMYDPEMAYRNKQLERLFGLIVEAEQIADRLDIHLKFNLGPESQKTI